jgi:long-chain acyl-CoA synthetase
MLISELMDRQAKRYPAKAALITDEGKLTYAELEQAAACIAQSLSERGLRGGDRIAILWPNSIELVVLMLGALRAGLIAVPINPRLKASEIAYVLEHSGARLCYSEPALAPLMTGVEVLSQLPSLTGASGPLPDTDSDAPALLLYTSGTTAHPKGVIHSQRTLFEGARVIADEDIGPNDIPLLLTPVAHILALVGGLLPALIQGTTAVLLKAFSPPAALDAIERHGCTQVAGLPVLIRLMVEEQAVRPRNVSSLRIVAVGGDAVPVALQQRVLALFQVEAREGYGLTEVMPVAFNRPGAVRIGSLGQAANASIRIVDSKGNDMAPEEVGELLVYGPANCLGYWNDPKATADLLEEGWLHTGDLASSDDDGYYWFKGRLKQIIIRGGSNISPQEVEEALYRHPAVLEAGVVGLPDPIFGEIPVAFVSVREGHGVQSDELIAHASRLLSDYKVPERIFFMDALPKGLTGKVDRRHLRDILLAKAASIENRSPSAV